MAEVVHLHKPQTHYFKSRFLYMTRANILTGPEFLSLLQGLRGGLKEAIEFGLSLSMIVLLCIELSLDTAGSFAKVTYIRDWIRLDIYICPAFPIG